MRDIWLQFGSSLSLSLWSYVLIFMISFSLTSLATEKSANGKVVVLTPDQKKISWGAWASTFFLLIFGPIQKLSKTLCETINFDHERQSVDVMIMMMKLPMFVCVSTTQALTFRIEMTLTKMFGISHTVHVFSWVFGESKGWNVSNKNLCINVWRGLSNSVLFTLANQRNTKPQSFIQ